MTDERPVCWVLTDGKAGTENQCLGLAEALGIPFAVHRLRRRPATDWVPAGFWAATGTLARTFAATAPGLRPPWPTLLIAAGRPSVGPALALRRAARGATFTIQLQDPRIAPTHFDLVIPPEHDDVTGPNVLPTIGALHRVTPAKLAEAAANGAARFAALPQPRIAVLVGGSSKHHRITPTVARAFGGQLRRLCESSGGGLMITASRRTDAASQAVLRETLGDLPIDFWDGTGDNPYVAMLAIADGIVVTEDSVTMACEAASTGKPLFVAEIDGDSPKFARFHQALQQRGISRPFEGAWRTWTYPPLHEAARVADEIRQRLVLPAGS
jgi:mitochondrial fission protein ELM1